jgi:serine/threonine protein kinase
LRKVGLRYSSQATFAVEQQDAILAVDVYDKTSKHPDTTTVSALLFDGYTMNGCLFDGSELVICYKDLKVYVLKGLSVDEWKNAEAFEVAFPEKSRPNIVDFTLYTRDEKHYMIMPKLETTLEPMTSINEKEAMQLWCDISNALDFIHSGEFAYMDVKPANICVNQGNFVLIDLGSIVKFGKRSSSTPAYIPSDFTETKGSAHCDWWMLAMTLSEKVECEENLIQHEPKKRTMAELMEFLEDKVEATIYCGLAEKLLYAKVDTDGDGGDDEDRLDLARFERLNLSESGKS